MRDLKAIGDEVVAVVKTYVSRALADVRASLELMERRIAAIPSGEKGEPGQKGDPGEKGEPGADGLPGRDGRDGLPGRDGEKGLDGKDGRDGADGKDGADGLGFDDFDMQYDGRRTFSFIFTRGEKVKRFDFRAPLVLEAGAFKADTCYEQGDGVTHGGAYWIAQRDTSEKPGDGCKDWRLAVRKGRDGRDGEKGEKGDPGDPGRPGRDLTQLGFDGRKH